MYSWDIKGRTLASFSSLGGVQSRFSPSYLSSLSVWRNFTFVMSYLLCVTVSLLFVSHYFTSTHSVYHSHYSKDVIKFALYFIRVKKEKRKKIQLMTSSFMQSGV